MSNVESERTSGPLQIHWHNPNDISEAEREETEARLRDLASNQQDLIDIWVDVRKDAHHRVGNDEVRIRCTARNADLIADGRDMDVSMALRVALDLFEREVRKMRDRRGDRGRTLLPEPPRSGVIDKLFRDDGYGFIVTEDGEQVYFHQNALKHPLEIAKIEVGLRVALDVEPGDKGPQATFVGVAPPRNASA